MHSIFTLSRALQRDQQVSCTRLEAHEIAFQAYDRSLRNRLSIDQADEQESEPSLASKQHYSAGRVG